MRRLDSLVMHAAEIARVPAGAALAVDRELFARTVTQAIHEHPLITLSREEITAIPVATTESPVIIATGPLTSPDLSAAIVQLVGNEHLYFYDAISPIVLAETINMNVVFRASRWDRNIRRDPGLGIRDWGLASAAEAPKTCGIDDGAGRLFELPDDVGRVSRILRGAHVGRIGDRARFRQREILRRLPADRSDGASRRRHAALRPDEAGGAERSADRPAAVRRRAAASGQPRRRSLQPRRDSRRS